MNITVENTGPCKKLLKIEVPYEEMTEDVGRVKQSIQHKANIPGFRAGKAPWSLVQQYYGGSIQKEIVSQVISNSYTKALEEKELHPIKQPEVTNVDYKEEKGLSYNVEVEHFPEFDLPDYKGININKKPVNITEGDVLKELGQLQERRAQFEPVTDRVAAMGDFVIINYQIMQKKEMVDEAKEVWIEMTDNFFIPKFCQNLVGMSPGGQKEIKAVLPDKYPKVELRNKKVLINVTANEIKRKVLSEINDEFAKEMGNYKDLAELKDKIKVGLIAYGEQAVRKEMVRQIEDYLLAHTKLEVPVSVTESFAGALYNDTVNNLKASGIDADKYIKEKDKELKETTQKEASDQVKSAYIFESIAAKEELDLTDSEINSRLQEIAKSSGKSTEEVRKYLEEKSNNSSFVYNMKKEKIINFLIENAKIKEEGN